MRRSGRRGYHIYSGAQNVVLSKFPRHLLRGPKQLLISLDHERKNRFGIRSPKTTSRDCRGRNPEIKQDMQTFNRRAGIADAKTDNYKDTNQTIENQGIGTERKQLTYDDNNT